MDLATLIKRPMKEWTQEEKDLFPELVNEVTAQGGVVVLPFDRCFYCGAELTSNVLGGLNMRPTKPVGLVMHLCEDCVLALDSAWRYSKN